MLVIADYIIWKQPLKCCNQCPGLPHLPVHVRVGADVGGGLGEVHAAAAVQPEPVVELVHVAGAGGHHVHVAVPDHVSRVTCHEEDNR